MATQSSGGPRPRGQQPRLAGHESLPPACPLCYCCSHVAPVQGADDRSYLWCRQCDLIYVDPTSYLPAEAERERYLTHRNGPDQPGHVAFLSRLVEPLVPQLTTAMRGLDFGSGPVPTLSVLLRDRGFVCDDYDPFFAPQSPCGPYDFITATEVFEHFFSPDREIRRLRGLLRVGGLLAVMTEQWTSLDDFSRWYYTRDPTHVSFFHKNTFAYIGRVYGFETIHHDGRVIILRRVAA